MTEIKENLEELCVYKKTCKDMKETKSHCALNCNGYDKLCESYMTLYDERLSRGFVEGGEGE